MTRYLPPGCIADNSGCASASALSTARSQADAAPAQGINPLVGADRTRRRAFAADAMKAVAAGNEVASDLVAPAPGAIAHPRPIAGNAVHAHVLRRIDGRGAGSVSAIHEIFGDLGLAVDHHGFAGQLFEREAVPRAVDANLDAIVDEPVGMHPRADSGLVQQVHRDLFDDAGAYAAEYMLGGLPLKNDVVDAPFVEELAEQ